MMSTKLLSAVLTGVAVMVTALLIYERPPDLGSYYQPVLQGILAALSALGINAGVRRL